MILTPKFKVQYTMAGKSQWQEIEATDQSHCTCVRKQNAVAGIRMPPIGADI